MKFLKGYCWECRTLVVPLVLIIVAATIAFCIGFRDVAWFLGHIGTAIVVGLNVLYVVLCDPLGNRKKDTPWQRFVKLMTFSRR